MAGLAPAIHAFCGTRDVDARDKPGHDDAPQKQIGGPEGPPIVSINRSRD
jgi:hypothetical protein